MVSSEARIELVMIIGDPDGNSLSVWGLPFGSTEQVHLFSYNPNKVSFQPSDIVGKTMMNIGRMVTNRKIASRK